MLLPQELIDLIFQFIEKDFCFNENYGFTSNIIITPKYKIIQEKKNQKKFLEWKKLFRQEFYKKSKFDKNIKKLCYDGIPPRLRGVIWSQLLKTSVYKKEGIYKELISKNPQNISVEKVIKRNF